jgi:hypothetical protein
MDVLIAIALLVLGDPAMYFLAKGSAKDKDWMTVFVVTVIAFAMTGVAIAMIASHSA